MKTKQIKNICCIGAGYVGGPTMAVIADRCPDIQINIVDINKERIEAWNASNLNNLPIFDPGLEYLISYQSLDFYPMEKKDCYFDWT